MTNQLDDNQLQSLNKPTDNDTFAQDMQELENLSNSSTKSPNRRGSESISGSNPAPQSDDDTLQNAHYMGIAPDADLENPQELNIAKDIDNAEELRQDS